MYYQKTDIMIEPKINATPALSIIIAQKSGNFLNHLKVISKELKLMHADMELNIKVLTNISEFNKRTTKGYALVFIEDAFLLQLSEKNNRNFNLDIVLLFDGHFVGVEAARLKKIIHQNSLNLVGHISLTNYPFDLIRLLVTDFVTSKFYEHQKNNS